MSLNFTAARDDAGQIIKLICIYILNHCASFISSCLSFAGWPIVPFYFKHDPSLSISKTELNLEEVRNIIFTVFKIINTSLKNFFSN